VFLEEMDEDEDEKEGWSGMDGGVRRAVCRTSRAFRALVSSISSVRRVSRGTDGDAVW
jgi:hypothetical protein